MKPTLVVLAAGMGSRYGGLKQVDPVGPSGEAILDYSVFDAHRAGFGKVVFIIRKDIEEVFRAQIGSKYEGLLPVDYAFQDIADLPPPYTVPDGRSKPWGTAHAIRAARNVVHEPFAAINADDFYGRGGTRHLLHRRRRTPLQGCRTRQASQDAHWRARRRSRSRGEGLLRR